MKILLTTELYLPAINGVVHSVITLKDELIRQGHDVRVVTLGKQDSYCPKNQVYTCSSISINQIYPGARIMLKQGNHIINDIIAWKPDIIHSQTEFSTFRLAKRLSRLLSIPLVHTYHTVYEDYTHYISSSPKLGKKVVKYFSRYITNQADIIIAPTRKVADMLINYHVLTPIQIIPSGLDLNKIAKPHTQEELQSLKSSLKLDDFNKALLFIGRLAKEKNVQEVLTFLSRSKFQNYTFIIVGDGPYRKNLKQLSRQLGIQDSVIFTGMVEATEVAKYYQMADIFVSASTSETQGLTYIEAMANGLACICRKDDCLKDVIDQGKTGYQYQTETEFNKTLDLLAHQDSLREKIGQQAQAFVQEQYSQENFANQVLNVYQEAIQENNNTHSTFV